MPMTTVDMRRRLGVAGHALDRHVQAEVGAQHALEHGEDRLLVALGRRSEQACMCAAHSAAARAGLAVAEAR